MLVELIVCSVIGILLVVLGLVVWLGQKISLVHDYHHQNVKRRDVAAYCREIGVGLLLIGGGTIATGIVDQIFQTFWGWLIFAVGFLAGFLVMNHAQKTYNGSWFG